MEQTKIHETNETSANSNGGQKVDKEKILAYVILGFLGLTSFGFGGPQYSYILSAVGFLLAIAVLAFIPYQASKNENKALLYYAIPLGIFTLFSSFSKFHLDGQFSSISSGLINVFGIVAFFVLGFVARKMKYLSLKGILYAVLLGLALLSLISMIASLAEYGFFYAARYKGMVYYYDGISYPIDGEYTMLFGFNIAAVSLRYGLQYSFLLAASLVALLFVSPQEDKALFITIASCGGLGLLSLIFVPYLAGLLLLIPVYAVGVILRFVKIPQTTPKWEKITAWAGLGVIGVLVLIVMINGIADIKALNSGALGRIFNNGRYLMPINEMIQAMFWKQGASKTTFDLTALFGMSPSASGIWNGSSFSSGFYIKNRVFEFNALYEGGLIAFLGLLVAIVFAIISLRKYLHSEEKISGAKMALVALILGWFIFASFESDSYPAVFYYENYSVYSSPIFQNSIFLVVLFLLGFSYTPIFRGQALKRKGVDDDED
jgi:hypothetical protein